MAKNSHMIEEVQVDQLGLRQRMQNSLSRFRLIFRDIMRISPSFVPVLVLNAMVQAAQIALAVFIPKLLLDALSKTMRWQQALTLVLIIACGEGLLKLLQRLLQKAIVVRQSLVQNSMMKSLSAKITRLPYSRLEDSEVLDLKERAAFALVNRSVALNVVTHLEQILHNGLTLLALLAILAQLGWLLAVFLLASFLVIALLQNTLKNYETNFYLNLVGVNRKYGYFFDQIFSPLNQQPVRIYNLEPLLIGKVETINREICDWMSAYLKNVGRIGALQSVIADLQAAVAYGYAGLRVFSDLAGPRIGIGAFSLYAGAAIQFTRVMRSLFTSVRNIKQELDYLEPYQAFMTLPEIQSDQNQAAAPVAGPGRDMMRPAAASDGVQVTPAPSSTGHAMPRPAAAPDGVQVTEAPSSTGRALPRSDTAREMISTVVFENVTFTYPGADRPVLEQVSFAINQGEKISIVGLNGAGKTTLVKLLCRFFEPDSGRILINGQDIRQLDEAKYLRELAAVFQDFRLLPFSLQSNVSSVPDQAIDPAMADKVQAMLTAAGVADFVCSLPRGQATPLNKSFHPDGTELSGGQSQKVAIARALYKEGSLIILDEPTSALDPLAEAEIYEHFDTLVQGQTALYISHRMSSSRFCDKVLVLENGKVAAFAPHADLIRETDSLYARLFQEQAKYYQQPLT